MLNKLQILAKLNEELKEFNPDYQYTKHLIENNIRRVAKRGQEVNQEKEFNIIHTEYELESRKKSKLFGSRWLSDGSLECEFVDRNGEHFTRVYEDDNVFNKRQQEREEKIKESQVYDNKEFILFGGLIPTGYNQEKANAFKSLMRAA